MIGRVFRLGITALVLLAVWRLGDAYLAHYRFADEVDRIAARGVRTDEAEVRAAVAEAAARLHMPVDPASAQVRVEADHVYIEIRYTRPVELLPRYRRPWTFSVSAHGWVLPVGGLQRR